MTKVYRYGLLAPTEGAEIIAQQCDLAWRSAIARLRCYEAYRTEREAILQAEAPAYAEQQTVREQMTADREALRALRTGRELPTGPEADIIRARLAAAKARLAALATEAKEQRRQLIASGRFAALEERLRSDYLQLARMFAAAGLFWGQRQLVEAAHDQRIKARGHLRYPKTWGAVGIQLQGGLSPEALATDPRVSISPDALPVPGRSGKPRPRLRVRIAPHDGTAEWPIILHRPLPAEGSIRFVKVTSTRLGRQVRWEAHFTVTLPDPAPAVADGDDGRVVAVRPTFTRIGEELVVAELADHVGDPGGAAPLPPEVLHPAVQGGLDRARGIQAVRDKARDGLLAAIGAVRASGSSLPRIIPPHIARWESCDKLRQFIVGPWKRAVMAGEAPDDELWRMAVEWATHDAHLWDWQQHARARALARRLHLYRVFAARLVERYDTVLLPDINYASVAKRRAAPERDTELSAKASSQRVMAAPGLLRQCLEQACQARGKRVVLVQAHGSPLEMLRERSSGVIKQATARAAKFAKRHRSPAAEAGRTASR